MRCNLHRCVVIWERGCYQLERDSTEACLGCLLDGGGITYLFPVVITLLFLRGCTWIVEQQMSTLAILCGLDAATDSWLTLLCSAAFEEGIKIWGKVHITVCLWGSWLISR